MSYNFGIAICNLLGSNQVYDAQNLLQRLVFVHCQRFLVDKSGTEQTREFSKTDKGVRGYAILEHICSLIAGNHCAYCINEFQCAPVCSQVLHCKGS